MAQLNKTPFTIRLRRGLRAAIELLAVYHLQGEPGYATDTKTLWISDGTAFQPVQTLDMALCIDDEIVSHDDALVWVA